MNKRDARLTDLAAQLDRLSERLNPALRPGHTDYINKADAVKVLDLLAARARDIRDTEAPA